MPDIRRQIGQFRRMIREQEQLRRWVWLHWAVPLPLVFLSFYFDWHWLAKAVCIGAVIAGAMSQADVNARIWLYRKKIDELEGLSKS